MARIELREFVTLNLKVMKYLTASNENRRYPIGRRQLGAKLQVQFFLLSARPRRSGVLVPSRGRIAMRKRWPWTTIMRISVFSDLFACVPTSGTP